MGVQLPNALQVDGMKRVHPVGSPQFSAGSLEADRQGGTVGLTSAGKDATLEGTRGDEAEDLITDVILLTDRLISFIGSAVLNEKGRA